MTRLDRIIKCFNDYDDLIEELAIRNSDNSQNRELQALRHKVDILIMELKNYGCRRAN